jgi:hypothetical protein
MPRFREQIPIHLGLNKSVEEVGLNQSAAALHDCAIDIVDNNIVVNRRPGLKLFVDTGESASIDGMIWWEAQDKMVVICNGKAFTIDDADGNFTTLSGTHFSPGSRVVLDDFETEIYGADGGVINKITNSAVTEIADLDAPQTVSHVVFLDQYLLANKIGTKQCHRSDVGTPETWTSNWFSAEAKNDLLRAIGVENLELYLLGDKTLEVWEDVGADAPFSRVPGGYIPSGTIAPHSFKFCASPVNTWVWLDHTKSLVALNGRSTSDLSEALNRYLQQDGYILTDAAGDFFKVMGHAFYSLHLPTQSETPVFDFKNGLWQNWSYWDSGSSEYKRWRGNYVAAASAWGKVLVGDRANGKVYTLDTGTYQDDGSELRTLVRTGHIDRGDHGAIKRTNSVTFRAKKTNTGGASTVSLIMRYRDDGETSWSNEKTITLSTASAETDYVAKVRRLGRYKTRQWEFYITDNAPLALLPPIEDFEVTY